MDATNNELIDEILANGFRVEIFRLWKTERPDPWVYASIQSDRLRDAPQLNSRVVRADTLGEALQKAANVARYIAKNHPL